MNYSLPKNKFNETCNLDNKYKMNLTISDSPIVKKFSNILLNNDISTTHLYFKDELYISDFLERLFKELSNHITCVKRILGIQCSCY